MSRIYISSTFDDLQAHRAAVSTAVRRLGHIDVAMEYYVAEHKRPLDHCLRDVAGCDLFVGLFARRYGFCPDDSKRSITELELRAAQRNQIDCLCFLLDDEADWPSDNVEEGAGAAKLAALRAEIENRFLAGYFTSPDELAAIVTPSIVRALEPDRTPFDAAREHRLWRQWRSATASDIERANARRKLANMGSPRYVAELKRLVFESDAAGVAEYLPELWRLADSRRELMPILVDLLESEEAGPRYWAVVTLGEFALGGRGLQPQILERMERLADDTVPDVRAEVAHALGKLNDSDSQRPHVRATLKRLAADRDPKVRERANESLISRRNPRARPASGSAGAISHQLSDPAGHPEGVDRIGLIRVRLAELRHDMQSGRYGRMTAIELQRLVTEEWPELEGLAREVRETAHDLGEDEHNIPIDRLSNALDELESCIAQLSRLDDRRA